VRPPPCSEIRRYRRAGLAASRQIAPVGAPARRVARAVRWLKDQFADLLRVESLVREARMSPSGFHQHFKTVAGPSPLQSQKWLHEAR
jgi:AraC-like DNA-binding protein